MATRREARNLSDATVDLFWDTATVRLMVSVYCTASRRPHVSPSVRAKSLVKPLAASAGDSFPAGTQHASVLRMDVELQHAAPASLSDVEDWVALGTGALLLLVGGSRRTAGGVSLALTAAPFFYRGMTGRWPQLPGSRRQPGNTKTALRGNRGIHLREAVRLEVPVEDVYRFWRQLDNLPRFMSHLYRVSEGPDKRSHWVAAGPAGLAVEWDAEIINEERDKLLAWRSLPGSDVVTAGSVKFDRVRDGRSTQVSVHLQYAPPAGKVGALVATLFSRNPSQTVREDLRRFKQLLEAGEIPQVTAQASE